MSKKNDIEEQFLRNLSSNDDRALHFYHHVMTILSFIAFVIFLHRYELHIMNIYIMFTPLTDHKRANYLETECLIRSIKRIYSLLCLTNENQLK